MFHNHQVARRKVESKSFPNQKTQKKNKKSNKWNKGQDAGDKLIDFMKKKIKSLFIMMSLISLLVSFLKRRLSKE